MLGGDARKAAYGDFCSDWDWAAYRAVVFSEHFLGASGGSPRDETGAGRELKIEEFQDDYRRTRRDAFAQSMARLQQASSAAVSAMMRVLVDPNTPAAVRLRAADTILGHAAKSIETEDIEVRVARLEAAESPDNRRY